MKKLIGLLIISAWALVFVHGCTATAATQGPVSPGTTITSNIVNGKPAASTSNPKVNSTTTASPPVTQTIPPGSVALFAVLNGSSKSDFLRVDTIRVNWDTTHFKLLRYIPGAGLLDEFGWTSSKSYSKSYIYGRTAGGWLYVVKCFLDSGRKDISRLDPATGKTVASFGPVTTADMYEGFTICGDRLIYRTEVVKDQLGRWKSGGRVMVMKIGASSPVEVLEYNDKNNRGHYYSMGNDLVSIVTSGQKGNYFHEIYRVNPETMALGETIYSFSSKDYVTFFEGDSALYWTETDAATGNIYVIRLPVNGNPVYYLEISDTIPQNLAIDESQGKVLLSFQDETPESPFYYLKDIDTEEITELEIEPSFFSKSILGNGQFVILK